MGPTRLPPSVAALLEALKGPEPLTCFRAPPFSPAIERQMTELLSQCRDGRELAAHGALLDDIEDHLETLGLGSLAAVLVGMAQSPKRPSITAVSEWPWPLAAAAGAKAGPALVEAAQAALHSQADVQLRGLALRLLALTMDVRQDPQAVLEVVEASLRCHVATTHTSAAFAVLALARRHPFLFPQLLNALRNGLASPATNDDARGYLLQACWYAPPQASVAVRKALEGSLPSLQPDPSLLLLALEGLARLPLVREHKSPLAKDEHPDPLLLTTTTLLRQVVGTQDVTVMVAAAALLCRVLCRKTAPRDMVDAVLFTLCEHLEAPASGLLKGVMVRAVATLLAYHSTASTTRLLDALVQVTRSAAYSGSEALSPLPLACLACLTSRAFERRSAAQDAVLQGLLAAVQERCSRVLGGGAGSTLLDDARATGEVRWLVSALVMLAGSGKDGAQAAVQIALQSPAEIAEEVLPQVAWVDRWDATATALQPQASWDVSWWVALLRASRGLTSDERSIQAAQAVEKALQDTRPEGTAMEVDGGGEERRLSGVWPRYQLAKEAILNGFYAPARRALEGLEASSDCMRLWVRCLTVLCEAETSAALCTEEGLLVTRSTYAHVIHLLGAIDATHTPAAAGFGFKKRFVEARLELLRVEAAARGLCRELMIAGRPAGYKATRQWLYQRRLPMAFRRLGNIFHGLYTECIQDGAQSRWVLRSLVSLCLVYAKAWELLVLQLSGSKAAVTASTGPWPLKWPTSGPEERLPLLRVCRTLHDRLADPTYVPPNKGLGFEDSIKAMLSLLWSVSRVPFPYPRCFFACAPRPGLHLSLLPLSRAPPPPAPPTPPLFTTTPSKSGPSTVTTGAQAHPLPIELQPSADDPLPILEVTCTADEHVSVSILGFLTHCSPETLSLVDQAHIQVRFVDSASPPGPKQPSTLHTVTARVDRTGAFQGYLTFKPSTLPSAREKGEGVGSEWVVAVQTRISTHGGHMWKPSKGANMRALLQLA